MRDLDSTLPPVGDAAWDSASTWDDVFKAYTKRFEAWCGTDGTPLIPDFSWDPGVPEVVRVTDVGSTDGLLNGKEWCSTCHNDPMGGGKSKGCLSGNCHNHTKSSF